MPFIKGPGRSNNSDSRLQLDLFLRKTKLVHDAGKLRYMSSNRQPARANRRWERRLLDVPIRVIAGNLSSTDVILGRGTKLSAGGICLFALANLAIGAQIDVELIEPICGKPIRVRGVIRNRLVYLYGVEFLINHSEDREQIIRLSGSVGGMTHLQFP